MIAAWGALLRLGRRDIRRSRRHAALIVALVALPVAGLVAQGTLRATVQPTPSELATRELGAADLAVYAMDASGSEETLRDRLPPDAHVEPVWRGTLTLVPTAAAPRTADALGVDLDGLGRGTVEIVEGRAPRPGSAEMAVASVLARPLGLDIGDEIQTDLGTARVVGLVRDPVTLDRQVVVVPPDRTGQPSGLLVELPPDADAAVVARAVEQNGADAVTRQQIARPDTEQTALNLATGGFAFLLTGFVAAAAFAVSAQRRQHDLALLAATGADARHLRRSVLATAIVLGGGGAVLGAAAGLAVSAATLPWLEQWTNRAVDGLVLQPVLLLTAAATGLAAAVGAAWVTARSAGRTPVAAALTGRRPASGSSRRLLVAGIAGVALGGAVTAYTTSVVPAAGELATAFGLLGGAACIMLGLGAVSPWLAERLAALVGTRIPVGVRLALRDTARFRSRTGPIVMAIVAGLGLSVAVGATLDTIDANLAADYRPLLADDQMLVNGPAAAPLVGELRDLLPVDAAAPLTLAQPADPTRSRPLPLAVALADTRLLDVLGAPEPARDALDAGQALVLQERGRAAASTTLEQAQRLAPDGVHVAELDLVPRAVPAIVLTRDALDRTGGVAREGTSWLVRSADHLTDQQVDQARELAGRAGHRITVETGPTDVDTATIQTVALLATAVLSLLIVAVGLALIGAETRDDDAVLSSVGAAPRTRRSVAAARAGILTLLGAVLAVPAGLVPVWGLSFAAGAGVASGHFTMPWPTIAAVVLLVPGVSAAGAYMFARSGPASPTQPVRAHSGGAPR